MTKTFKIAFVGAGQLAQMLAQAGQRLGMTFRSAGANGSCAFSDCEPFTDDLETTDNINDFLNGVDIFTFESEHEGLEITDLVEKHSIPIRPNQEFIRIAGDRLKEKTELESIGIAVAPFAEIDPEFSLAQLEQFLNDLLVTKKFSNDGIVVKTRRGGYDGKGQWVIKDTNQVEATSREIISLISIPGCIVEGLVDFEFECSILASRSLGGDIATWPLTHNIHEDSILKFSYSPITNVKNLAELEKQALGIVEKLCTQNGYIGTIAVECFYTKNGLIVNEIAPRVHNSGHWTIEGSKTSQFEQHIRAITGMELGSTDTSSFCAMINLVGVHANRADFETMDNVYFHWYGKEVREKRKVGHITVIGSSVEQRDQLVSSVLEKLGI